jgi:hypothetical protein
VVVRQALKKQLFCILKINTLRVLKNTKNYVKQRLFLVNALIREAGLTLLTTNGIILLCFSYNIRYSSYFVRVPNFITGGVKKSVF